jgi:hypothetical protein
MSTLREADLMRGLLHRLGWVGGDAAMRTRMVEMLEGLYHGLKAELG